MKKYTINLPNIFYFLAVSTLIISLFIMLKVIFVPLLFSFFLP
jgi:hypothetical protein